MKAVGLEDLLPSWALHLPALNRSSKTISTYLEAARQLLSYLEDKVLRLWLPRAVSPLAAGGELGCSCHQPCRSRR